MMIAGLLLAANVAAIDPLVTRWTFGAHEPYTMYRRMGKKSTGGIEGSALWLKDWLLWWDAKAPEMMRELGLNGLHSRFYKGMGWEEEKKDFPNVQKFVRNCHANGVTALAYVQFSTLYFEPMRQEIPNLDSWAQVDEHGEKRLWNNYYFRWMPCMTCEEWQAYMEKIVTIALTEGGFDGIMFDNVFVPACYCQRCERKFAEHLAAIADPEAHFGFSSVRGIRQPLPTCTNVKDPVYQEWLRWRVDTVNAVMARFRRKIKSVKPDAIVSANAQPFRASANATKFSLEMISFGENLDLFMMQSDSFPAYDGKTGVIVNRVRDLKLAAALGKPIVALCDANAGQYDLDESEYLRPLVEDLIWKGIPTDRTVMSPKRLPGFIDRKRLAARKPQLAELNALAKKYETELRAPSYQPVRILYPATTLMFSAAAHGGVTATEEILLRNHVPFGYLIAKGAEAPDIPSDCEVLIVANQEWLSDAQIAAIAAFAKGNGRVVVTGESGLWNERGCQRFENPLRAALKGLPGVVWRERPDAVGGGLGWRYRVEPPKDGGRALMADLAKTGWQPKIRLAGLPSFVFAEFKQLPRGIAVLLMNYNPSEPVRGATISTGGATVAIPEFGLFSFQAPVVRTIHLAGDSTLARRKPDVPNGSWGDALAPFLKSGIAIENHATSGRSTKSFMRDGRWERLLAGVNAGDYVFIQFGHNDANAAATNKCTTLDEFSSNLRQMVGDVRAKGAKPVLLTPIAQRFFSGDGKLSADSRLGDYADRTKSVASEMGVTLVDMRRLTRAAVEAAGVEKSLAWYMAATEPRAKKPDNVHPTKAGAKVFADLFLSEVGATCPELDAMFAVRKGSSLREELVRPVLPGHDYASSTWSAVYNRLFDLDAAADDAWRTLRTTADYDAHRLKLRAKMIELTGGFPDRTPLNPRVTGRLVRDGYRIEKILFESLPGAYVTGLLYLPDPAHFTPPYKAALEVCGHSFLGKGQRDYRRVAVLAAKAGLACLVIDPFAQGERSQCPEDLDGKTTASHLRLGVNAMLLGHGLAAFEMWDAIRALDYLDARDDLLHDGYGVMGNSGGGTQSVFLSGLDDRIVATATCSFLSNLREQTAWRLLADSEQIIYAQLPNGLNHAAHPLMGGHPVLMLSRRDELIPFSGTRETARLLAEVGRNLGVPDRYGMYDLPGPHGYNELNMRRSAAYLVKRLTGRDATWPEGDADAGPEGPDALVTPTGRVMDLPGFRSAFDSLAEELTSAEKARKRLTRTERALLVRKLAVIDDDRVGERRVVSERESNGVRIMRGYFETREQERLPFVEFVPSGIRGAPVICVADSGRTNHAVRLERELAAGNPVVVADISSTGEIGGTRHHYVNPHDDEEVAKMLYILGASLVGRRAGDLIAMARDVRSRYGLAPRVAAVGRTCVAAAHARAAEPELIASVETENAPLPWAESVRTRAFYDYAASVHGGLIHYDWIDLLTDDLVE